MGQVLFDGLVPYIFLKKFSNKFNKKNIKKIKTNLEECILFFNDYSESFIKLNDIEIEEKNNTLKKNFSIIELLNKNNDALKFNNIYLGFDFKQDLDDSDEIKYNLSEYATGDFDRIILKLNKKISNKIFDDYYQSNVEEKIQQIIKVKIVDDLERTENNIDTIYLVKKDLNTYAQYLFDEDRLSFIYFNDIKFYNLTKDLFKNDIEFILNKYLNISKIFDENMQGYVKEKDLNLKLENYVSNKRIASYQTKKDIFLDTENKEIVGSINEIKQKLNLNNIDFETNARETLEKINNIENELNIIKEKQEEYKIAIDKGLEDNEGILSVKVDEETILINNENKLTINKENSLLKVKSIILNNVKENEIIPLDILTFPIILQTYKLNEDIDNIDNINITNFENNITEENKLFFNYEPIQKKELIKIPIIDNVSGIIRKDYFVNINNIKVE